MGALEYSNSIPNIEAPRGAHRLACIEIKWHIDVVSRRSLGNRKRGGQRLSGYRRRGSQRLNGYRKRATGERRILSAIEVVFASRSMAYITGRSRVFIPFYVPCNYARRKDRC